MRFDVGQRVHTPDGRAIVESIKGEWLATSAGIYRASAVMAERDYEILQDPANVEAWLEGEFDEEESDVEVELREYTCKCDCNKRQKRCGGIQHWAGAKVVFSAHTTISTDCRCKQEGCWCLTG